MINLKVKIQKRELLEIAKFINDNYHTEEYVNEMNVAMWTDIYNMKSFTEKLRSKFNAHYTVKPTKLLSVTVNINEYNTLHRFVDCNWNYFEKSANIYFRIKFQALLEKLRKANTEARHLNMAAVV